MVFSHSDAIWYNAKGMEKSTGPLEIKGGTKASKTKKKFEWKPFHLLLVIYCVMAAIGVLYRIAN